MSPQRLPDLQAEFIGCLFEGDAVPRALVAEDAERFSIYRATIERNLCGALRAVYPVVARLTGQGFFDQAARRHMRARASTSGDLHRYGHDFADTLAALPALSALPYIADVARLEWLWHEAFHAADAAAADLARLADTPASLWPALRLALHPASRLLHSPYPVLRIWAANQEGAPQEGRVSLDAGESRILVCRQADQVVLAELGAGEYRLLEAALRGERLADALGAALTAEPGFDAGAALRRLVAMQAIADFHADS